MSKKSTAPTAKTPVHLDEEHLQRVYHLSHLIWLKALAQCPPETQALLLTYRELENLKDAHPDVDAAEILRADLTWEEVCEGFRYAEFLLTNFDEPQLFRK